MRGYRLKAGGITLRIVRGDLHRHTELSQDIGGLDDGSLPEFYRYMIDAAAMDFGASTDHQAGGTDYWAFMTQKMADMYHFPERFVPLYAYERNIANPDGHRQHHSHLAQLSDRRLLEDGLQVHAPRHARWRVADVQQRHLPAAPSCNDTKLLYEELRKSKGPWPFRILQQRTAWGPTGATTDPKIDAVVEDLSGRPP